MKYQLTWKWGHRKNGPNLQNFFWQIRLQTNKLDCLSLYTLLFWAEKKFVENSNVLLFNTVATFKVKLTIIDTYVDWLKNSKDEFPHFLSQRIPRSSSDSLKTFSPPFSGSIDELNEFLRWGNERPTSTPGENVSNGVWSLPMSSSWFVFLTSNRPITDTALKPCLTLWQKSRKCFNNSKYLFSAF